MAGEFLDGLLACGTTTALVFGSHFAPAMDVLFAAARAARAEHHRRPGASATGSCGRTCCARPEQALAESRKLIERWHGHGRLRYAVTPRFSLSASDEMLDVCGELLHRPPDGRDDIWFTSHLNENPAEVATVADLFPGTGHYLDTYHRHGLVTERSVFAHNVHASDAELALMGEAGAWTAHCPTSNSALGSGLFPLRRHVEHGVGVALGSDVGAGTGLFLPKEGLQAYFMQQLLGAAGAAADAGAPAVPGDPGRGPGPRAGRPGRRLRARARISTPSGCARRRAARYAVNLDHAADATDALARTFALATPADVAGVWVRGRRVGRGTGGGPAVRSPGRIRRASRCADGAGAAADNHRGDQRFRPSEVVEQRQMSRTCDHLGPQPKSAVPIPQPGTRALDSALADVGAASSRALRARDISAPGHRPSPLTHHRPVRR